MARTDTQPPLLATRKPTSAGATNPPPTSNRFWGVIFPVILVILGALLAFGSALVVTEDGHKRFCRWTGCRVQLLDACDVAALCPPPPAPDRWANLTFTEFETVMLDGNIPVEQFELKIRSFHALGDSVAEVNEFNRWVDDKLKAEQVFVRDCKQGKALFTTPDPEPPDLAPPGDASAGDEEATDGGEGAGLPVDGDDATEHQTHLSARASKLAEDAASLPIGKLQITTEIGLRGGGVVSLLFFIEQSCPRIGEASKLRIKSLHYDFERAAHEVVSLSEWVKSIPEVSTAVHAACQELGFEHEVADDRSECGLHLPWHLSDKGLVFYPLFGKAGGRPPDPLLRLGDRNKLLELLNPDVANRLRLTSGLRVTGP